MDAEVLCLISKSVRPQQNVADIELEEPLLDIFNQNIKLLCSRKREKLII